MNMMQDKNNLPYCFNDFGEAPLPDSPIATLENNSQAIPQQFLHYQRTVENVEAIISFIDYDEKFPIFVFEEQGHVFLQVGIIGHENYPPQKKSQVSKNDKIVYGRRWYIEPYTPTSEIIQTAFLAINKVREHEVRELLSLSLFYRGKHRKSTPFNCHLDIPFAANNKDLFVHDKTYSNDKSFDHQLLELADELSFGSCCLSIIGNARIRDDLSLISCCFLDDGEKTPINNFLRVFFPELINQDIDIVCNPDKTVFLHELIGVVIKKCEEHVKENFTFKGFARYSHTINPLDLAKFSLDTRLVDNQRTESFNKVFRTMVKLVDGSKAPSMAMSSELFNKQKKSLDHKNITEGYLPIKSYNKNNNIQQKEQ